MTPADKASQRDGQGVTTNTPSTSLRRQRFQVGVGVVVLGALFLTGLSINEPRRPDSVTVRRNLLLSSEATPVSYYTMQGYPHTVFSYMAPPEPSPIPQERVYGGIHVDSPEKTLDFFTDGCRVTSQVRVVATSPKWIVQTFDLNGERKYMGGDELYVTYTDSSANGIVGKGEFPTAVAKMKDLEDGTYELDFVTTPMDPHPEGLGGSGSLRIYFQYSCGIGTIAPLGKQHWNSGGASHFFHKLNNMPAPPMRTFQPPTLNGMCFSDFTKVIGVGDSVLNMFFANGIQKVPNLIFGDKMYGVLSTETMTDKLHFLNHHFSEFLHGHAVRNGNSVALVVGSSTWDILMDEHQDPLFRDHFAAVRSYIEQLRLRFPNVTIIWMGPNALHIHRVTCKGRDKCAARIKYLSTSRTEVVNRGQKAIMEEMGVPFLDLYEAYYLSSEWSLTGDGRHYNGELTNTMIRWFHDWNDCSDRNATVIGEDNSGTSFHIL